MALPGPSPEPVCVSVSPLRSTSRSRGGSSRRTVWKLLRAAALQRRGAHALPPGHAPWCVPGAAGHSLPLGCSEQPEEGNRLVSPSGGWRHLTCPYKRQRMQGVGDLRLGGTLDLMPLSGASHKGEHQVPCSCRNLRNRGHAQHIISSPRNQPGASRGAAARVGWVESLAGKSWLVPVLPPALPGRAGNHPEKREPFTWAPVLVGVGWTEEMSVFEG